MPARLRAADKIDTVDFWVEPERSASPNVLPNHIQDVALRKATAADLAAVSRWVNNWQRMLPVIVATHGPIPKSLAYAVGNADQEPIALARLEFDLAVGDPSLARGAVFESFRTGLLSERGLRTEAVSLLTLLEPVRRAVIASVWRLSRDVRADVPNAQIAGLNLVSTDKRS